MPYKRVSEEPREDDPKHPRDKREKPNPNPKIEWRTQHEENKTSLSHEEKCFIRFIHFQTKNHPAVCDKCEASINNICFWRGEPDDDNPGEFKPIDIQGVRERKPEAYRAKAKTLEAKKMIPPKERPFMLNESLPSTSSAAAAEKVCTVFFAKNPPPPKQKIKIVYKSKPNQKIHKKKTNKNDKVLTIEKFFSNIEENNPPLPTTAEVEPLTTFNFVFRNDESSELELANIETETENNSFAVPQLELTSDSSLDVNPIINEILSQLELPSENIDENPLYDDAAAEDMETVSVDTWALTNNILDNIMGSFDRSSSIPEVGKSMPII